MNNKIKTGFIDIDHITNDIKQDELIIVGGRPGMGKTAFALSMILNNEIQAKKNIVYFSLELSYSQVFQKLTFIDTGIQINELRKGKLSAKEIEVFVAAFAADAKLLQVTATINSKANLFTALLSWVISRKLF